MRTWKLLAAAVLAAGIVATAGSQTAQPGGNAYVPGSGGGGVTQIVAGTGISLSPAGGTGAVTVTNTGSAPAFSALTTGTNTNTPPFIFNPTIATGTITNTFELENAQAASTGNQADSPAFTQCGNGWGTTGASSQPVCFQNYILPSQSTVPFAYLVTQFSVNGGAYVNAMSIESNGLLTASSFSLGESAVSVPTGLALNGGANTWALSANNALTMTATSTLVKAGVAFSSAGTAFAIASGTGACATTSTIVGGVQAGHFTCTGTTGASTVTLTLAATTNSWSCVGRDITTPTGVTQTGALSTTAVTLTLTSVTASDVVEFHCLGY
jgi:hypothetical protein